MPKSKRTNTDSSYDSDSDSGPDDRSPLPKKSKDKAEDKGKESKSEPSKASDENSSESTKSSDKESSKPAKVADKEASKPAKAADNSKSETAKGATNKQGPWTLERLRQVRINEFRGRKSVDIREFYEKDGDILPGKKGISLSLTQWLKLMEVAEEVTAAIRDQ